MSLEQGKLNITEKLTDVEKLSDDELRAFAVDNNLFERKHRLVVEKRETFGEGVCFSDVVTILGVERGLWDDLGYPLQPSERAVDSDFSEATLLMAYRLMGAERPWLINLLLRLKHGIRMIDDESLLEIAAIVEGYWPQADMGDEIFDWRLLTLQLATRAVLADRGYGIN